VKSLSPSHPLSNFKRFCFLGGLTITFVLSKKMYLYVHICFFSLLCKLPLKVFSNFFSLVNWGTKIVILIKDIVSSIAAALQVKFVASPQCCVVSGLSSGESLYNSQGCGRQQQQDSRQHVRSTFCPIFCTFSIFLFCSTLVLV